MTTPIEVIKENLSLLPTNLMATAPFLVGHALLEWLTGTAMANARGPQDTISNQLISDGLLGVHVLAQMELVNGVYCSINGY
jgi:hypothetical protein